MQSFRLYFAFAILVGAALLWAAQSLDSQQVEEFYGFAQTEQTEINFNYPIEVQDILVQPGQAVRQGEVLMRVKRARPKETLADQNYRIEELQAEQRIELQRIEADLDKLSAQYERTRQTLLDDRSELVREQRYRQKLLAAVGTVDTAVTYRPLESELAAIDSQLALRARSYESERASLLKERGLATAPFQSATQRLAAERDFDASQAEVMYDITAPSDGVVGNVNAKLAEHKSSFSPLVIFYEPNPRQVRAFIHEDRVLEAQVGDAVYVSSITSEKATLEGRITGMGSRIVEIPSRLRRIPEVATYGREVIVSIPASNPFLQNEKVMLAFNSGVQ